MSEFQILISEISGVNGLDLQQMLSRLLKKDMGRFLELYRNIVISCTSYMDAKENAYHMLFLGMCITLRNAYKVTSNLEAGYGRSDITLQALSPKNTSVIVEFKQGGEYRAVERAGTAADPGAEVLCGAVGRGALRGYGP